MYKSRYRFKIMNSFFPALSLYILVNCWVLNDYKFIRSWILQLVVPSPKRRYDFFSSHRAAYCNKIPTVYEFMRSH